MTLVKKLRIVGMWDKEQALSCWINFHEKWERKHRTDLFHLLTSDSHTSYIQMGNKVLPYSVAECETFRRYAQMWHYKHVLKYRHMDD